MPRKVRELFRDLQQAGFEDRGGKGSHRNFRHASGVNVTVRGGPGDDAKPYQEKAVKAAIRSAKK
ncbi:MAG: type II toxin-antitoxin system HicA family toxin [Planctomycetia bacterium]|nr:type II toxin-antitoxin system HicA family toxin [Planctomycetia bacterium]